MRCLPRLALVAFAVNAVIAPRDASAQAAGGPPPQVVIETALGDIRVALDPVHAPTTTANFLRYVDQHFYDDTTFYRTVTPGNQPNNAVKIEVVQGGLDTESGAGYGPIPLERTSVTGLSHVDGAISMARDGPDTGSSEFFICLGNQPELDFGGKRNLDGQGFAAFGHVVSGMDVVRKIQQSPAKEQRLDPPVKIVRIRRAN